MASGCGVDFVFFLEAAFDPNTQCSAGIIVAIFLPPIMMLITWPAFGEVRSLLKFVGLFITAGGLLLIHRYEQAADHQTG